MSLVVGVTWVGDQARDLVEPPVRRPAGRQWLHSTLQPVGIGEGWQHKQSRWADGPQSQPHPICPLPSRLPHMAAGQQQ